MNGPLRSASGPWRRVRLNLSGEIEVAVEASAPEFYVKNRLVAVGSFYEQMLVVFGVVHLERNFGAEECVVELFFSGGINLALFSGRCQDDSEEVSRIVIATFVPITRDIVAFVVRRFSIEKRAGVPVGIGVRIRIGVAVAIRVGIGVRIRIGVGVRIRIGVGVRVAVRVRIAVAIGRIIGAEVAVLVGVATGAEGGHHDDGHDHEHRNLRHGFLLFLPHSFLRRGLGVRRFYPFRGSRPIAQEFGCIYFFFPF